MSITPSDDYVDRVWIEVIDLYINNPNTQAPIIDLLRLLQKLIADPDNHREILDQEYLARRNAHDASQSK